MRHRDQRGFTLMELMVVIVIVAILAAVAVPLYINYVNDAKRTEAKGAIAALISAAQVYYQKNGTFVGMDTGPEKINVSEIVVEAERNWTIGWGTVTATTFIVDATGKNQAATLEVRCTYDRALGAKWVDDIP